MQEKYEVLTPYENFVFALKARETKRQYPHRLDKFLTFIGLEGTIPEKCNKLYELRSNIQELESHIIGFIIAQKVRTESKNTSSQKLVLF